MTQPTSPIDIPLLMDRCMDDASLALMVLSSFQSQAADDMAELTACVQRVDSEAVSRRAHALKGTSGAVAATGLMDAACRLEEAACTGASAELPGMLRQVQAEMLRCLECLPGVSDELRAKAGA